MTPEEKARWSDLESRGLVELYTEPDECLYDDSYLDDDDGFPAHDEDAQELRVVNLYWNRKGRVTCERWTVTEGCECRKCTKADLWSRIERDGVWDLMYRFRTHPSRAWESHCACGGIVGDDWKGSGYDDDAKIECMWLLNESFQEEANELAERATFAAG